MCVANGCVSRGLVSFTSVKSVMSSKEQSRKWAPYVYEGVKLRAISGCYGLNLIFSSAREL